MSTTFTWAIANLVRESSDGFVFTVFYSVDAVEDIYWAGANGEVEFERPDNLIPFEDLTEETVIGWTKEALGADKVDQIHVKLQKILDERITPTKRVGVPWVNPCRWPLWLDRNLVFGFGLSFQRNLIK
tara:strand:- start:196 stop:582 length:387 start_codon:yes stop_codon:yes gene_type:complete